MLSSTKRTSTTVATLLVCSLAALIGGCATIAKTGTLIGAGIGAAAGQWIGDDTEATLIGAGVGAAAGYMIGNEADKQQYQDRVHDDDSRGGE